MVEAKGAVLVVGSLLWEETLHRHEWRKESLRLEDRQRVRAPIGYGRKSLTRGDTFTMVIEPQRPHGAALLVPFRALIRSAEELIAEAESLWQAERSEPTCRGPLGANWGCVGVLFRNDPASWAERWRESFVDRACEAVPPVDQAGRLDIDWPISLADGSRAPFDVILATATRAAKPSVSARAVAEAWIQQSDGHERYFFENVRHGIRTHEDAQIFRHIEAARPAWIDEPEYRCAISILRAEGDSATPSR